MDKSLNEIDRQDMKKQPVNLREEKRKLWAVTRSCLEANTHKHKRYGGRRKSHWTLFERLNMIFGIFLKIVGLYARGHRNAKNVVITEVEITFKNLPGSFHEYKILHLTDLHLDCVKGLENIICEKIKDLNYDLCVITGDYREKIHGTFKQILTPMKRIARAVEAQDGIWAVLGNHDSYLMVNPLEAMGISVLTNETVSISRGNEKIVVSGIDDPNCYYTDQALSCLEEDFDAFKIALVHSPELYDIAAKNDYDLYLCGHTHGGQICLPGGIPLITHVPHGKRYYRGLWQYHNMMGYTSQGCGSSGIPVRYNTHAEIALLTLKVKREN